MSSFFRRVVFLSFVLFMIGLVSSAQGSMGSMDPSKVDIAKLDDAQIARIISEIEKKGLSENEAINLARARGMSQSQVDLLRSRIKAVREKAGGGASSRSNLKATESSINDSINDSNETPKKKSFEASEEEKRLFGFKLFNSDNLSFEPNVNLPASPSYILGPGDELLISVWGNSEATYNTVVDKTGVITIPAVGAIRVGGYKFQEAQKIITARLSSIYSDIQSGNPQTYASITLGNLKSITVNVIGEAFTPGTYVLPATATAFNALYLSGGPNILGSFRDIRVIRDGKVFKTLDVFDYLINGNSEVNCSLSDGDVILIPTYEYRVKIGGETKREGIFEAKKGETLADLLKYAGGFKEDAYKSRVELYRKNAKEYSFVDVDSVLLGSLTVQNGDSIYVGAILNRFSNMVTINGAVFKPGNYQLSDSLSLKTLIERADGLKEDAFQNRGLISRENFDLTRSSIYFSPRDVASGSADITLQKNDVITIYSIFDLREEQYIEVFGMVNSPGSFLFEEKITLNSAILMANGFRESGSEMVIEVSRKLPHEETLKVGQPISKLFQFNVDRDLKIAGNDGDFELEPFDQVFIRKAPSAQMRATIKVLGEVSYSGEYSISSKKERISDIINRAGGITPDGYVEGAILTRPIILSKTAQKMREEMMLKDSLLKFSSMTFEVVVIDLKKILQNPGGPEDIYVKEGDELTVPSEKQTVKVSGEVTNGLSLTYTKGMSVKKYIRKAGGFGVNGKRSRTYVVYPNGESDVTKRRLLFFNDYPKVTAGSEIVVPTRPKREPMTAGMWISIASAAASIALTIATISSLNNN